MKRQNFLNLTLGVLLSCVLSFAAQAESYKVDASHSGVSFEIRHMFTKVKGQFKEFEGNFIFDDKKVDQSSVDFKIVAKSIDTNNQKRDDHLRNEDFFAVAKFADITFKSKKVTGDKTKLKITGDLKMHGVSKEVTFEAEMLGTGKDPWGNEVASFTATTTINRKDFGINYNKVVDNGGLLLGEDVKVTVDIEGQKAKGDAAKSDKKADAKPADKKK